jgi:hypothetical protein
MPDWTRANCQICGKHRDDVGPITWRGYCAKCARRREVDALDDLHFHRGPTFAAWRRGMAASVGAVILDDVLERP